MSQENVEVVRRIYDAWSSGDFTVGRDVFDPDIEYAHFFGLEENRVRGVDEMRRAFGDYLSNWDNWRTSEIEDLIESGDHVVAIHRIRARGKNSKAEVELPDAACAFTFRDGKIVGMFPSDSRRKALEAVGLSE